MGNSINYLVSVAKITSNMITRNLLVCSRYSYVQQVSMYSRLERFWNN